MANDETPVRFGIIGCAEIARKMSRAINLSPNSTIYAIAIYMPLPTSFHLHWAILVAEKKKHLLLEKPTALNVSELDKIIEACERNGVQFMDASMWYHHPRTAKMKEFILILNSLDKSKHSSSYSPGPEFLENNIRVKPDLDALGALGDAGWYCIGAILWAMNQNLPTTVTALPTVARNSAGVILTCSASLYWEKEETVATFYCSFVSHETMDLKVYGSNGTFYLYDFIIPMDENSASFSFTFGAKFVDRHIGWNVKPQAVEVNSKLPQEAAMIQEFSRLVKAIEVSKSKPESKWPHSSRVTQLVLDAVNKSIDLGFQPVHM
ncbi:putative oxidoreductase [Nicotiana attenuata]|uniref:Oxidoreductase n=1 Tax=Nicotiana attenuata TaxID=49451 RepID=A0A314L5H6_NICAT|nr:putative oxidoreductase [Nicotiana attenuata]